MKHSEEIPRYSSSHSTVSRWVVNFVNCVFLSVGITAASPIVARSQCPTNLIHYNSHMNGASSQESTLPMGSFQGATYDLIQGTVSASAGGNWDNLVSLSVSAKDEFEIIGVAAGQPMTIEARLTFSGTASAFSGEPIFTGFGDARVLIRHVESGLESAFSLRASPDCDYDLWWCNGGSQTAEDTLRIELAVESGIPFTLRLFASAGGQAGSGNVQAQLGFSGLPDGASIVSCQGFQSDAPVQLQPTTFGRLKSVYR